MDKAALLSSEKEHPMDLTNQHSQAPEHGNTQSREEACGGIVDDIMRTHPMLIIGGILYENPFFVPPEEFLQQLRTRRVADETPQ
jgi:hypothetical protein